MICFSLYLLVLMSIILQVDGLVRVMEGRSRIALAIGSSAVQILEL